jgi:hypothetical protein
MLQELPSAVQYNIHVSHQIAVCIQQLYYGEDECHIRRAPQFVFGMYQARQIHEGQVLSRS